MVFVLSSFGRVFAPPGEVAAGGDDSMIISAIAVLLVELDNIDETLLGLGGLRLSYCYSCFLGVLIGAFLVSIFVST